jgi:DNA invertase Pin-like site-specific DNA recombinase
VFDGYIRVSQTAGRSGERFISPVVQREQIQSWAAAHGRAVGEIFEELDASGARGDRPMLLNAIERIEAGISQGLIVARLDRFGRSVRHGIAAIERIRAANGTVVCVQDGLDLSTDSGTLVFHILLSMGQWELERIRESWDVARAKAISRGVHVGSTVPFGYQRGPSGRLTVDAETGPLVAEMFRRRADGATLAELGRWLENQRARTARGNPFWCTSTLSRMLTNRVYLGELRAGQHVARETHDALVGPGDWRRAQSPRVASLPNAKRQTLLGGLLRCAGCGRILHSRTIKVRSGRRIASYFCDAQSSQGRCDASASVTGPTIETFVEEAFFGELFFRARNQQPVQSRLRQLQAELQQDENELDAYRDRPRIVEALGEERYVQGLRTRMRAVDLSMQALAIEERRIQACQLPSASELEDQWPALTVEERRNALGEFVDCVFVARGWGEIGDRVSLYFRGEEPSDLPGRGWKRRAPASFDRRKLKRRRLRRPPRWSKAKIRERLEAALEGLSEWPLPEEFTRTGNGPLYAQVIRTGGPEHWAIRMNKGRPSARQGIGQWNRRLAQRTLRDFVRGRKVFPTQRDFSDSGYRGLYAWLQKHGGMGYWAAECGLPRARNSVQGEAAVRRRWAAVHAAP